MARVSTKENKNIYQLTRESLKLTRESASELLESQIVLEMLASLNSMHRQKERLIEITADGRISGDELADFIYIQEELERISITVETLQLWSEKMLATGVIDIEQYNALKGKQV